MSTAAPSIWDQAEQEQNGTGSVWDQAAGTAPAPKPNALQRFSEVTLGTQHPLDELKNEASNVYHHPGQALAGAAETFGIPHEIWSDPSTENFLKIGGTGIPGMVFGEHGAIKDPIGFGENITGANQAAEDAKSGNWKGLPGDIIGGVTNLAMMKKPAEAAGGALAETAKNAKAGIADAVRTPDNKLTPTAKAIARGGAAAGAHALGLPGGEIAGVFSGPGLADAILPKRPVRTTPFGPYTEAEPLTAANSKPVPITKSPYFDPEAYKAGKKPKPSPAASPFAGMTPSTASAGKLELPEIGGQAAPAANVPGITPTAAPSPVAAPTLEAAKAPVVKLPEPRKPLPGENPNYNASIPRARLLDLGRQGRPGAGDQLRNIGKTVLYVPPEGYPGPRPEVAPPNMETAGATSPVAPPNYAYRAHTTGEQGIDLNAHAHATMSPEEAEQYAQHREGGVNQKVSKIDLSKENPEDYVLIPGPNGNTWVKFKKQPGRYE